MISVDFRDQNNPNLVLIKVNNLTEFPFFRNGIYRHLNLADATYIDFPKFINDGSLTYVQFDYKIKDLNEKSKVKIKKNDGYDIKYKWNI
jgi:hypothetical protein